MKNIMFLFVIAVAIFLFEGLIVKLLWNMTLPELFKAPALDYWQALAMIVLSNILFKTHYYKKKAE